MTIEEIVKNKKDMIAMKMMAVKHSDPSINIPLKDFTNINKEVVINGFEGFCKAVANTYYWLDSHGDVHVKGCFTNTIKMNKEKIYHLDCHNSSNGFRSKVGNVKDVIEMPLPWSAFGVDKEGDTISVIGVSELIEEYNKQVYDAYKNGEVNQHSVGMIYVNIALAINDEKYPEEYKEWLSVYPLLGNPDKADKEGYFWVVKEAKLKEYSCLLWDGSNSLTPTSKDDTKHIEPQSSTQTDNESAENRTITEECQKQINHLLI
jgi:hypothetical protein